jgi:hypothetical protein
MHSVTAYYVIIALLYTDFRATEIDGHCDPYNTHEREGHDLVWGQWVEMWKEKEVASDNATSLTHFWIENLMTWCSHLNFVRSHEGHEFDARKWHPTPSCYHLRQLVQSVALLHWSKSKSKLLYDWRSVSPYVLVSGPWPDFTFPFLLPENCIVLRLGAPSLTRGRVCNL